MLFSNDIHTQIARTFMPPATISPDTRRPFLYLLRRDLVDLYGPEDSIPDPTKLKAPLLTSFGVMDGFDLLAKLWTGKHDTAGVDTESFLITVCHLDPALAAALVQFRHSAGHGYRLGTTRRSDRQQFKFALSDDTTASANAITETASFAFTINIWALKRLFVEALKEYRALVEANFELQQKFVVCLANLGECEISRNIAQSR